MESRLTWARCSGCPAWWDTAQVKSEVGEGGPAGVGRGYWHRGGSSGRRTDSRRSSPPPHSSHPPSPPPIHPLSRRPCAHRTHGKRRRGAVAWVGVPHLCRRGGAAGGRGAGSARSGGAPSPCSGGHQARAAAPEVRGRAQGGGVSEEGVRCPNRVPRPALIPLVPPRLWRSLQRPLQRPPFTHSCQGGDQWRRGSSMWPPGMQACWRRAGSWQRRSRRGRSAARRCTPSCEAGGAVVARPASCASVQVGNTHAVEPNALPAPPPPAVN